MRTRNSAFTLIELLIVVAVIGILMTMLSGAILKSIKNAKHQRKIAECASLKVAIINYWHDYGRWPCDTSQADGYWKSGDDMGNSFSATMAKKYFPSFKESNYKVFQYMLYSNSKSNPMAKSYIEENAIMVGNASDGENRVPVSKSEPMTRPVVGYNKSTDKFQPYTVNFDFKQDNVDVN